MVPIGRSLWPGFDLFVGLEVMPCLTASFVQEPPSLDVGRFRPIDRGHRRAIYMLLSSIGNGIAIAIYE